VTTCQWDDSFQKESQRTTADCYVSVGSCPSPGLRDWVKDCYKLQDRLPSPQRGRGAGGEGDTSLLNQHSKLASG